MRLFFRSFFCAVGDAAGMAVYGIHRSGNRTRATASVKRGHFTVASPHHRAGNSWARLAVRQNSSGPAERPFRR
jgi:hypothetical protein